MKYKIYDSIMNRSGKMIVWIISVLLCMQQLSAQVVSVNGAYVSMSSGTVINFDTIHNNNSGTLANGGTINLASIINTATIQGSGTYNITNLFTNTGVFTANNSIVNLIGNINQSFPAVSFYNLSVSGSSTTKTATGNTAVNGTLTINSGVTIDMVTNSLSGTLGAVSGTGTLKTQNTSATPIPSGKTWTTDVQYNSSSPQIIVYGNYANLNASGGDRIIDSLGTVGIAGVFTLGAGAYTATGTTIDFNGSIAQIIPGFNYHNLKVSGGNTKTLGGNINLRNTLSFGVTTILDLSSYNIRLKSDSTYTARVGFVPSSSSVTYGTGRFISDRYVIGRRKFRLTTSPVTTSPNATLNTGEEALSIWGNWQNQGNDVTANVGTIITGGTAADGFDQHTTKTSLFTYNSVNRSFIDFTSANGKNTKYTPLKAGVPYFMFIYGDRTNYAGTAYPKKTILSATGKIITGDQSYTTGSTLPLDGTVDRYTMIGNPFASPIDWTTVSRTNLYDTYWGWDPNLSSTGGFVTVNSTGTATLIAPYSGSVGIDQYIQSGQAFFVRTVAASPQLIIKESDKVDNYNPLVFRTNGVNEIPLIAVNLFDNNKQLLDGALTAFSNDFTNIPGKEDASKIASTYESVAIQNRGELLSIDARKFPKNLDTIFLNMARLTQPNYSLQIFAKGIDTLGLNAYLYDSYRKTTNQLQLVDTNMLTITVDPTNEASANVNRFYILFKEPGYIVPVFNTINATRIDSAVKVEWGISNDAKVSTYVIQRSVNGQSFSNIGSLSARRSSHPENYNWIDLAPVSGTNQYKIKAIENDGREFYSKVVSIIIDGNNNNAGIKVYPNPVRNQLINLQLNNLDKGQYTLRLLSVNGKEVMRTLINHQGSSSSMVINTSAKLSAGIYILQVANHDKNYIQKIILEN